MFVLFCLLVSAALQIATRAASDDGPTTAVVVLPEEDPVAVLHNPNMGWVLYENYPLDQDPHGSSTLLTLPDESFSGVDAVALMFSWADVEKEEGQYDFSKANFAYDYWRKRGKEIHLRVSTESLLWWTKRDPPSGQGVPDFVLARLAADLKQTRYESGLPYTVVDARNAFYQERLGKFLLALRENFNPAKRPVTLIDLRGFGLWGEWHSGFRYADTNERHQALCAILDLWSRALPDHFLSLSYSYDPDGPSEYFAGPRDRFDRPSTAHFDEFFKYSAFDCAMSKPNITFRRDGCGGAVHSNERLLCEKAFDARSKGPFMSEFLGGYAANKKAGEKWLRWMLDDAISLHPNYIALLGWQGADARDFMQEEGELVALGLREMGYRLVPKKVTFSKILAPTQPLLVTSEWINRGVGRAPRNFHLHLSFYDAAENRIASLDAGELPTSQWIKGATYRCQHSVQLKNISPGEYTLRMQIKDPATLRSIQLPLRGLNTDGSVALGKVQFIAEGPGS